LLDRYFPDLGASSLVIESACDLESFLKALPEFVRVIGAEIDPGVAERAHANTDREIPIGILVFKS
jgi:hypothetical protein